METALITGASKGIGLELAYLFAKDGYDLLLVARSKDRLEEIKKDIESKYDIEVNILAHDLSVPDSAKRVEEYCIVKGLDVTVLVNNAGFGDSGDFATSDYKKQLAMVNLNVTALMELTRMFLPQMVECNEGKILNVASIASTIAGPKMAVYYATKAFVRSFTEAIHEEVKGTNICVTALCPGPVKTGFEESAGLCGKRMFKVLPSANAKDVAMGGYKALHRNQAIYFHSMPIKFVNFLSKIAPRCISRKCTKWVNS